MFIRSVGMCCPVGLGAAPACAALRAGIAGLAELPFSDRQGEPVVGGPVPDLVPGPGGEDRVMVLLRTAVEECLAGAPEVVSGRVPLLVGQAERGRPGGWGVPIEGILAGLESATGRTFDRARSRAFPDGHTAGFEGLRRARRLLEAEGVPACLVCAADSFVNAESLGWLEGTWRLKTAANSDGAIPGEGAAAVLVTRAPPPGASGGVAVTGLGFAVEPAPVLSDDPLLGLGLASAARAALAEAGLGLHELTLRLSDVTGEQYGFKEQALMVSRLLRQRMPELPIRHAADAIGDTGAAAGLIHLILARQGSLEGDAPANRTLVCASAVPGARAAAVIRGDVRA